MAKFYVNEVHDQTLRNGVPYGQSIIGLFKQCATEGRGSCCGYYGVELYIDTEMYAYYIADDCRHIYRPEARMSDITIFARPIKYDEVVIGSHMWTTVIEAETVEEAIKLFENAEWRRWHPLLDEMRKGE